MCQRMKQKGFDDLKQNLKGCAQGRYVHSEINTICKIKFSLAEMIFMEYLDGKFQMRPVREKNWPKIFAHY